MADSDTIHPETLKQVSRKQQEEEAGPPGAEGTRRAIIDEGERWAAQYEKEEQDHMRAASAARANARFWTHVARAAKMARESV